MTSNGELVEELIIPADQPSTSDKDVDDVAERRHFLTIGLVFHEYGRHGTADLVRRYDDYIELIKSYRHLIDDDAYPRHVLNMKKCVQHNAILLKVILTHVEDMFAMEESTSPSSIQPSPVSKFNMEKLHSTMRQIQRDWSRVGASERAHSYEPVLDIVRREFNHVETDEERGNINILVPGAGLARLAWQLAADGYTCQANETSLFMLFVANFVLNHCPTVDKHVVYPWVHTHCNNLTYDDQLRSVRFPDVDTTAVKEGRFSMCAGEFVDAYSDSENVEKWHSVLTVFFLDTAANVCAYIQLIFDITTPGGLWVNLGPLLYHYEGMHCPSIALPFEAVRNIVQNVGFVIEEERHLNDIPYTLNERSMMKHTYSCVLLVCRKPIP